jgi:hypothetical protein
MLAAGLATVIGVAVPALGSSDQDSVSVEFSNQVSPPSNVGQLSVDIASTTQITSLTVSLYQDGTDLLDLPMSDFTAPSFTANADLTWTVSTPITTEQLSLGQYTVEVTAEDEGGGSVTDAVAGTLIFENEPQFTFSSANGTSFSLDNQDVTFQGTAQTLPPGGTLTPLANQTIDLDDNVTGGQSFPVMTGSDGSFTVTEEAEQADYWVEFPGNSMTASASSASVSIAVTQFPVQMTAHLKTVHTRYGAPDSVSGTATYADGAATDPLAGNTVSLYYTTTGGEQEVVSTAVTSSTGDFTLNAPTTDGSLTWTVATTPTIYFPVAQTSLPMTVAEPNKITSFKAQLTPFAVVTVSGCITSGRPVVIQYAKSASGPWQALGTIRSASGDSCQQGKDIGSEFAGKFGARLSAAYYRAVFAGSQQSERAVSKALFLQKFFTKITSFTVSPSHVVRNGTITVSGKLWAQGKSGKFAPDAHKLVLVMLKYHGANYRYAHEPETNSAGQFRWRFKVAPVSAPTFAQYDGDSTHLASASKRVDVTVSTPALQASIAASGGWIRVRDIWQSQLRIPA